MATNVLTYDQRKESISKYDDDIDVKVAEAGGENANVDYSGFTQKTDPVEIKLVRKLDLFIMVSVLRAMALTESLPCGPCTGSTISTETLSLWLSVSVYGPSLSCRLCRAPIVPPPPAMT